MKRLLVSILCLVAGISFGQNTYHGNFIGNANGVTNAGTAGKMLVLNGTITNTGDFYFAKAGGIVAPVVVDAATSGFHTGSYIDMNNNSDIGNLISASFMMFRVFCDVNWGFVVVNGSPSFSHFRTTGSGTVTNYLYPLGINDWSFNDFGQLYFNNSYYGVDGIGGVQFGGPQIVFQAESPNSGTTWGATNFWGISTCSNVLNFGSISNAVHTTNSNGGDSDINGYVTPSISMDPSGLLSYVEKGKKYTTNWFTLAPSGKIKPDMSWSRQYFTTNGACTFGTPIAGVTPGVAQETVVTVYNTSGGVIALTPAVVWDTNGTWNVTNGGYSRVAIYIDDRTNAICTPIK